MDGSGKIRVVKRDGSDEEFSSAKLAGAMWRAMRRSGGRYHDARELALAVEVYLRRTEWLRVPSAAIFEMAIKVLGRCGLGAAGAAMEAHRGAREAGRQRLRILHDGGKTTLWDKSWLSQVAQRGWFLLPQTARILAGEVETHLLAGGARLLSRQDVLDLLNERVAEHGLADAVPVPSPVA